MILFNHLSWRSPAEVSEIWGYTQCLNYDFSIIKLSLQGPGCRLHVSSDLQNMHEKLRFIHRWILSQYWYECYVSTLACSHGIERAETFLSQWCPFKLALELADEINHLLVHSRVYIVVDLILNISILLVRLNTYRCCFPGQRSSCFVWPQYLVQTISNSRDSWLTDDFSHNETNSPSSSFISTRNHWSKWFCDDDDDDDRILKFSSSLTKPWKWSSRKRWLSCLLRPPSGNGHIANHSPPWMDTASYLNEKSPNQIYT